MWLRPSGSGPFLEGLPNEVAQAIRQIVRRLGLWPSEREDVARELAAHFRDGMDALTRAGRKREEAIRALVTDFGDPAVVSRLIGREKRRCRPAAVKLFVVALKGTGVAVLLLAAYVGWVLLGQPEPKVNYLALLNEPVAQMPAEDHAWPLYREALIHHTPMPQELYEHRDEARPGSPYWLAAEQWLAANSAWLPKLREAARKPALGDQYSHRNALQFMLERARAQGNETQATEIADILAQADSEENPDLLSLLLPSLHELRQLEYLMLFQARQDAAAGRVDNAIGGVLTTYGTGRQLLARMTLIEQLVGGAILRSALDELRQLLAAHEDQIDLALLAELRSSDLFALAPESIRANVQAERMIMLDTVQRVFTDDGKGDGVVSVREFSHLLQTLRAARAGDDQTDSLWDEIVPWVHAGRRETIDKYEELWGQAVDRLKLPLYAPEREGTLPALRAVESNPVQRARYALVTKLLPSFENADRALRETAMNLAATQAVVALFQHQLEKGSLPPVLADLVPEYLGSVPVDEFDGQPLKYRPGSDESGSFVLYSIYRNFQDDDACLGELEPTGESGPQPADLVYWPASTR